VIHVLALSLIAVVLRHPEMVEDSAMVPVLPTPLSEVEEPIMEVKYPDNGPSFEISMPSLQSEDTSRHSSFSTAYGYHDIFTHRTLNRREFCSISNTARTSPNL
jgi:hypothetical protein